MHVVGSPMDVEVFRLYKWLNQKQFRILLRLAPCFDLLTNVSCWLQFIVGTFVFLPVDPNLFTLKYSFFKALDASSVLLSS